MLSEKEIMNRIAMIIPKNTWVDDSGEENVLLKINVFQKKKRDLIYRLLKENNIRFAIEKKDKKTVFLILR